jgi:WD40 repeat protein
MRRITLAAVVIFCCSMNIAGQAHVSVPPPETATLPKPSFVLHDQKLHPEKPHTVLGANGSFAAYAGTSMIQVSSLSFSGDGKLLAVGSTPGIVDVWDVISKQKVCAFKGGTAVALSPDGHWLVKDGNGIEVIDIASAKVTRTIPWSTDSDHTIENISFDPSGQRITVATNGLNLEVFDVNTGSLLATLANTRRGTFSPDGSLVVGGDYRHLMTWNTKDWQVVRDLPNGPDYVTAVAADPNEDIEIIGGPKSARLLKITSGQELGTVGAGFTNYVAINNSGTRILTYSSQGVTISDASGKPLCSIAGNGYYAMALSPDNRWLAAAPTGQLTDVAVWEVSQLPAVCSFSTQSH